MKQMDDPMKGAVCTVAICGFICDSPEMARRACPYQSQLCSAGFEFTVIALDFYKKKKKCDVDVIDSK